MLNRIILAGNGRAASEALQVALGVVPADGILVVAPSNGPKHSWQVSLANAAREAGVRVIEPDNVNDPAVVSELIEHDADVLLSVYYTQLFRRGILEAYAGRIVNLHPSLLPRHRGTAPLVWTIVGGDVNAGLTVHYIDEGVDTGSVITQHKLPVNPDDTGYSLQERMSHLAKAAVAHLFRVMLVEGVLPPGMPQVGNSNTHSSRDPALNHLDWADEPTRLRNIVRALAPPFPGAFVEHDGSRMVIAEVSCLPSSPSDQAAGSVRLDDDGYPVVRAGTGLLRIEKVVNESGSTVEASDVAYSGFQNGAVLA